MAVPIGAKLMYCSSYRKTGDGALLYPVMGGTKVPPFNINDSVAGNTHYVIINPD